MVSHYVPGCDRMSLCVRLGTRRFLTCKRNRSMMWMLMVMALLTLMNSLVLYKTCNPPMKPMIWRKHSGKSKIVGEGCSRCIDAMITWQSIWYGWQRIDRSSRTSRCDGIFEWAPYWRRNPFHDCSSRYEWWWQDQLWRIQVDDGIQIDVWRMQVLYQHYQLHNITFHTCTHLL